MRNEQLLVLGFKVFVRINCDSNVGKPSMEQPKATRQIMPIKRRGGSITQQGHNSVHNYNTKKKAYQVLDFT